MRDVSPGQLFYCPNGHSQIYATKSYQDRINDLERHTIKLREERDTAIAEKEKKEKEAKRLKKRIQAGVCPCCKRTFRQLSAHMENKHPDFVKAAQPKLKGI